MLKKFSLAVARLPPNCPRWSAPRCGGCIMHRLSLSRLLHLMTFLPLVALVVFGATIVVGSLRAYRDIEAVNALEDLVTAASSLTVFALNQESTKTHPFVASGSESARTEMMATRLASDDAIRTFK